MPRDLFAARAGLTLGRRTIAIRFPPHLPGAKVRYNASVPPEKKRSAPPRRYPGLYEKLIPMALIIILAVTVVIVLIALAVGLGIFPVRG